MLSAKALPIPEARNTPPNIPPAPVIKITEQTGPNAPSMVFSKALAFSPRLLPNTYRATKTEISKAIGVEPSIRANCTQPSSALTIFSLIRVDKPVFKKINSIGISIMPMTVDAFAGAFGWSLSCVPPLSRSGTGTWMLRPKILPNK